jgi:hypothetical protein
MLPHMSASEFTTLDRILELHEDEMIREALADLRHSSSNGGRESRSRATALRLAAG